MRAASRQALSTLRERLDAVTPRFSTTDGLTGFAEELYQVVDLLTGQPQLRRRLADPTTDPQRRADLIGGLLDGQVSASAIQVVRDAVALRWSTPWDMLDAVETAADEVLFAAGDVDGAADEIEDELFRFGRILDGDSRLATLLDDYTAEVDRRLALLDDLLASKVNPVTTRLLEHAVASGRKRTLTLAIDALLDLSAARRARFVARVISAVELTAAQERRLATALSELYGRAITVRSAVDPDIVGGLVVRVGDELIDGSVATRLVGARLKLGTG